MTKGQASAMNNKFVQMKREIDGISKDYSSIKSVADSLVIENIRNVDRLRKSKEYEGEIIRKVNNQWIGYLSTYLWARWAYFVLFNE
jgi:hypothetical protein